MAALARVDPHAGGRNELTEAVASALQQFSSLVQQLDANNAQIASALQDLASTLEAEESRVQSAASALNSTFGAIAPSAVRAPQGPLTGGAGLIPGLSEAQIQVQAKRMSTARLINSLCPAGQPMTYSGSVSTSNFFKDVWDGTIGGLVSGIVAVGTSIYDHSPINMMLNPNGYQRTLQQDNDFFNAIVNDRYPDGTAGARAALVAALGDAIIQKDLLDKDPAAWMAVQGVTLLSLLFGVGETKLASRAAEVLGKESVAYGEIANTLGKASLSAEQLAKLSPLARLMYKYPNIAAISEKLVTAPEGLWKLAPLGPDGRGMKVEGALHDWLKKSNPNLMHLFSTHKMVDYADLGEGRIVSVKSLDTSAASYADNPAAVKSKISAYAKALQNWGSPYVDLKDGTDIQRFSGKGALALTRDLYVAIPEDGMTDANMKAINDVLLTYNHPTTIDGEMKPAVNIHLVEVPR